ncbi:MAG: hypothetical protein ACW9W9_00525 [Candidatus Nitrosopumilus sp. Bin_571-38]
MKHLVCIKHPNAIFTICSTFEEQRDNQYQYGMTEAESHLIKHDGDGCKLVPVDFQKARNYDGI